jgi:hypothetical protein
MFDSNGELAIAVQPFRVPAMGRLPGTLLLLSSSLLSLQPRSVTCLKPGPPDSS